MKRSLLLAAIISAAGAFASDSYLYWMINNTTSDAGKFDYAYVRIRDANTTPEADSYLTIYDGAFEDPYEVGGESGVSKTYIEKAATRQSGFYASLANISDLSSASFIVELYNDEGKFLAQSFNNGSYSTVNGYIYSGGISVPPSVAWTAGTFALPEPSSGLLMLVGFAMLGLRRRRQAKENA